MEQDPSSKMLLKPDTSYHSSTRGRLTCLRSITPKHMVLLLCSMLLLWGSFITSQQQPDAHAASNSLSSANCSWHRISAGDTLNGIAYFYRANIWTIARVNRIRNINLIYTGQSLCIPSKVKRAASGLHTNGYVSWYNYRALDWSTRMQAHHLLRSAAARYGLPVNLMLAIAWQESGWRQHVIARDGGIGIMQIMPYTAQGLNRQVNGHYDPYKLYDNIELGAIYLRALWHGFNGNMSKIISAYNEGGWNVRHRGIFNWRYVHNVRSLMSYY
ncbi:LysM peptidoglycan-binding domain-containing protein [Dictyobacter kobayashii]|uniref:LysM domain-containing protein n=1 Tax=Dictyobacter kobayashii TaxID=2014872 RepID=A0A402ACM0_9CHLR|nr:transglycosylase SLT domain-containing protein [Dictyobacter kobayashii]GCE16826.1 hypothetical protein KDK_06260 [Dictyobacter kobayashii]